MAGYMFLVVAYDITSDRRRAKLVKTLKNYGERVNYSVFECVIKRDTYPKLSSEMETLINKKRDSVLLYDLCGKCVNKAVALGAKKGNPAGSVVTV